MKDFFFARERHVCQQIGEKNLAKGIKILSLSRSQFSRKRTPTDKAAAVKVLRKITTQHRQLIFHEIFTKDITPSKPTSW